MARSPEGRRRSSRSRSDGKSSPVRIVFVIDGLVLVVAVLALATTIFLRPDARTWAVESLACGWVPVGLWFSALVFGLRYHTRSFPSQWQWWLISAAGAVIAIGVLSFFHPGFGLLSDVSLGGQWGTILGGSPLSLGIAKLLVVAVLTPVVVFPRRVGPLYARGFEEVGQSARFVAEHPLLKRFRQAIAQRPRYRTKDTKKSSPLEPIPEPPAAESKAETAVDDAPTRSEVNPEPRTDTCSELSAIYGFVSEESVLYTEPVDNEFVANQPWLLPVADLLTTLEPVEFNEDALGATERLIEQTLASHGVNVTIADTQVGPRLVRFGIDPGWQTHDKNGSDDETEGENSGRSRVRVQPVKMTWP